MKSLLLALCFAVIGHSQEFDQRAVLDRLKALETEMAKRPVPVRWAYANKSRIQSAIYERAREKQEELKRAEPVPPEVEAKVAQYEALKQQLMFKSRPVSVPTPSPLSRPVRTVVTVPPLPPTELSGGLALLPVPLPGAALPPPTPAPAPPAPVVPPGPTAEEKEYEALVKRVAEAKIPVAKVIERRAEITAKYHSTKFLEQLVADYVKQKEHFDVVVDASNDYSSSRSVLYRSAAEVPDITEGILQFFHEREKR